MILVDAIERSRGGRNTRELDESDATLHNWSDLFEAAEVAKHVPQQPNIEADGKVRHKQGVMQRTGGLVAALTHRLHGNIVRPKLVKGHVLQFLRLLVGPWAHLDLLAENHELLDHLALPF